MYKLIRRYSEKDGKSLAVVIKYHPDGHIELYNYEKKFYSVIKNGAVIKQVPFYTACSSEPSAPLEGEYESFKV